MTANGVEKIKWAHWHDRRATYIRKMVSVCFFYFFNSVCSRFFYIHYLFIRTFFLRFWIFTTIFIELCDTPIILMCLFLEEKKTIIEILLLIVSFLNYTTLFIPLISFFCFLSKFIHILSESYSYKEVIIDPHWWENQWKSMLCIK